MLKTLLCYPQNLEQIEERKELYLFSSGPQCDTLLGNLDTLYMKISHINFQTSKLPYGLVTLSGLSLRLIWSVQFSQKTAKLLLILAWVLNTEISASHTAVPALHLQTGDLQSHPPTTVFTILFCFGLTCQCFLVSSYLCSFTAKLFRA